VSPLSIGAKVVSFFLFFLLLGARKLLGVAPIGPATEAGSTWAEDLEHDRRFERSLITRQIAVLLAIVLLIVLRELFS
jgi:hypothetical protein